MAQWYIRYGFGYQLSVPSGERCVDPPQKKYQLRARLQVETKSELS